MLEQNLLKENEKISKRKISAFEKYHNGQQVSWNVTARLYCAVIAK